MAANGNGKTKTTVNWTLVFTVAIVTVTIALLGPISWRASLQATEQEMKIAVVWLLVLLTLSLFVSGLVGVMNAFSRMTLRHVEQDDQDEARKADQQTMNLVKAILALSKQQQGNGVDMLGLLQQLNGNGYGTTHQVRDVTSRDVNME